MAVTGATTSWGEYLKYIQGSLENLMTEHAQIQRAIPFDEAKAEGRKFIYPVVVRGPHGTTHAQTGVAKRTAYDLNPPISSIAQEVEIDGKEFTLQEDIAAGMIAAAAGGAKSDGTIVDQTLALMRTMSQFYLELELLHGGRPAVGIGVVESVADVSASNICSVVITKATWAAGIWAEMEGALVDVYDDDGDPLRNTALSCAVSLVDPSTRTITLTGTEAELDNIAIGDVIMPSGWYGATAVAGTANTFKGLMAIASHTSGDLLGINASTYTKWIGNTFAVGSAKLTMEKLLAARRNASARGAKGDINVLLSEYTWDDLNNDLSALRQFASDTKSEMALGTQNIKFYSSGGILTLEPHPMCMSGELAGYMPKRFKRIGTHDPKMEWPKDLEMHLENKKAMRFRESWCQGLLPIRGPASCFYASGIVNQSLV